MYFNKKEGLFLTQNDKILAKRNKKIYNVSMGFVVLNLQVTNAKGVLR